MVSRSMASGSLTVLSKLKPGCAPDINPIAVVIDFLSPYSLVWFA